MNSHFDTEAKRAGTQLKQLEGTGDSGRIERALSKNDISTVLDRWETRTADAIALLAVSSILQPHQTTLTAESLLGLNKKGSTCR